MFKIKHVLMPCLLVGFAVSASHASILSSTTILRVSPGNSVTTGTAVTLDANVTVTVLGIPIPVTLGLVQFCDADSPQCTDSGLLGLAQLTLLGHGTAKLLLGPGTHHIVAEFLGVPLSFLGSERKGGA
jgi:hypothetical protein